MKTILATRYVSVPEGVQVDVNSRIVKVTGPRGELSQSFKHLKIDMVKVGKKLRVDLWFGNRKQVSSPHLRTRITYAHGSNRLDIVYSR